MNGPLKSLFLFNSQISELQQLYLSQIFHNNTSTSIQILLTQMIKKNCGINLKWAGIRCINWFSCMGYNKAQFWVRLYFQCTVCFVCRFQKTEHLILLLDIKHFNNHSIHHFLHVHVQEQSNGAKTLTIHPKNSILFQLTCYFPLHSKDVSSLRCLFGCLRQC